MQVIFRKATVKRLRRMQHAKAKDIRRALAAVAADPNVKHANLHSLRDVAEGYRLRVGNWRVSFILDRKAGVMEIFEIEPRGGAYRW